MSENNVTPIKVEVQEPFRHQFGKMALGSIVGFVAAKGAEKLYDVALQAYRAKRAA